MSWSSCDDWCPTNRRKLFDSEIKAEAVVVWSGVNRDHGLEFSQVVQLCTTCAAVLMGSFTDPLPGDPVMSTVTLVRYHGVQNG